MSTAEVVEREYCTGSSTCSNNNEKETSGQVVCYVCGGNGANWALYTKANEKEKSPYFPFLESMEKARGAKGMKNGRIDACTVCFSFLLQQWHTYEELRTPVDKRTYWLKRTGVGGIDFNYCTHGSGVEGTTGELNDYENSQSAGETSQKAVIKNQRNSSESSDDHTAGEEVQVKERDQSQELQTVVSVTTANNNKKEKEPFKSKNKTAENETSESCFVCGCRKIKDVMKTVHTKPQLKTETPFYPFLLLHNSPSPTKKIEFTGKVIVCGTCDSVLLKQWQHFQKQGIPLSERQYRLPFGLGHPQNLHVTTSTLVCFICGDKQPGASGWDMHTRKGRPGNPYFPFLARLSPSAGAKSVTAEGLVKTCTECHNSLLNQWILFESRGLDEDDREYSIPDNVMTVSKSQTVPENKGSTSDVRCYVCKFFYPEHKIQNIKKPWDNNCVTSQYNEQHPGKVPVCSHCKKVLDEKAEANNFESTSVENEEQYSVKQYYNEKKIQNSSNLRDYLHDIHHKNCMNSCLATVSTEVCFLCGEKIEEANSKQLCALPRKDESGCKPFFPSLAYMVPAYCAKPLAASGTVIVCCYCHGNMMNQWHEFGKSDEAGISNPWSRQYFVSQFICYLCGKIYGRQKITSISARDYPFLNKLRRPAKAFRINGQKDFVVCHHCKEIVYVQKDNFDKCGANVHEREYELPMVNCDSKMCHISKSVKARSSHSHPSNSYSVVVVGDNESECSDREVPLKLEQSTNRTHDFNSKLVTTVGNQGLGSKVQAKESPTQSLPMSSPAAQNSSFAAYLRKLAKQAMSPGSQSPALIPPSNNASLSPVKNKVGCESPKLNGGLSNFKKEVSDPSFLSSKENRGHSNLSSAPDFMAMSPSMGHQVVPGVYSLGPRGYESKSNPLDELHGQLHMQDLARVRAAPPQPPPSHPFYMPFLQRPAMGDSVYMSPFPYYPPTMVEPHGLIPPGFDHETWRKRRAMEHLRQQHERHTHFFSAHDRPLYVMEQDQVKPLPGQTSIPQRTYGSDLPHARDKSLGKTSPTFDSSVVSNGRTTNGSIPKETEKDVEVISPRATSSRTEPMPVSCSSSCRHHSYSSTGASITSPGSSVPQTLRSSPGSTPRDEKDSDLESGKDLKQREHQLMWTRKMFEQKRRLRQEEIEWQHRQQQMRQQKREVQQELYQFRQKLLQQKESELEDVSKKEQGKHGEKRDMDKTWSINDERSNESSGEGQRMDVEKIPFSQFGYSVHHDQPAARQVQAMHVSNIYRPPGGQQRELFYPPGYPPQASLSTRMDTRMYREYLQQPSHYLDNKAVSEWLEKQRHVFINGEQAISGFPQDCRLAENYKNGVDRLGSRDLSLNRKSNKNREEYNHEPQKLKFLKDLGLMTVSEKEESSSAVVRSGKQRFGEDVTAVEDEHESNKENRMANGERIWDVPKSTKRIGMEQENDSEAYYKQVDFLSNLGLVTHRKRKELEDDFEKNRWERRTQRLQRRPKRTKREKKEEKERTPLDLDISGPITRQKQQLLQEYGLVFPIKDSPEKGSSSSPDSVITTNDQKEKDDQEGTTKTRKNNCKSSLKGDSDKVFHNSYEVSTPPPRPSPNSNPLTLSPQLTLQSLTHVENPYRGFPSAFRPPFYHSGLLSMHQNSAAKEERTLVQHKPLFLPEELSKKANLAESQPTTSLNENCAPVASTDVDMYPDQGFEITSWLPEYDVPKWPGTKKLVLSYRDYNKEQENELNILTAKGEKLKMDNSGLNKENARLSSTYSGLIMSKRELEEDKRMMTGKLDKLRNFLVFVQNS